MSCLSEAKIEIIPSRIEPTIFCITFQCCTNAPYLLSYDFPYSTTPDMDGDYSWRKVYRSFKGTQDWDFFWLRFWNLYYFFISYVKILRFYQKKIFIGPLLGEVRFFRVVLGLRRMKKNFELGQKIYFLFFHLWTLYMSQYWFFQNSIQ